MRGTRKALELGAFLSKGRKHRLGENNGARCVRCFGQAAAEEHNAQVKTRWLAGGGEPTRNCWWHITEITLDHLRPSPEWKRQMEELDLAKECEARLGDG